MAAEKVQRRFRFLHAYEFVIGGDDFFLSTVFVICWTKSERLMRSTGLLFIIKWTVLTSRFDWSRQIFD